ncbi:MAG: V-type ATPase subunit [Spirochaetes bacterium]|nr:V-type ATPase subunit [Spirochaetota bacterium]
MGKVKKYAFINAKLRARKSKILKDDVFDNMAKAKSLPEAIRLLHNTHFQKIEEVYVRTGDLKLAELELYKKEISLYYEIEKHISGDVLEFVRGLTRKYEVENLKAALRLWFDRTIRKRNIAAYTPYLYREKIHYDLHVDQIINVENIESIAVILEKTPYAKIIKENSSSAENLFSIELALDKYFYQQLYEKAIKLSKADFAIVKRIIGIEVDVENISWFIRSRDFYKMTLDQCVSNIIPYGYYIDRKMLEQVSDSETPVELVKDFIRRKFPFLPPLLITQNLNTQQSKLLLLGRFFDQIIIHGVRKIKVGNPFTIGILMAYFVLKKNEISKVMTILNAKCYDIDETRIKSVI